MSYYRFSIVGYFDAPQVLDASVTAIPGSGSSPLQVIASTRCFSSRIFVRDGIGTEMIGLYVGASGQESLKAILGCAGPSEMDLMIQAGSRVSLRSMGTTAINRGLFCVMFMA